MARRTGKTVHALAEVQAGTGVDAQHGDEIRISDLEAPVGVTFDWIPSDSTPDDGTYTIDEVPHTALGRWRRKGSNIVGSGISVPYSALLDNTEENISVALTGVATGSAYAFAVVSGLPTDTELELDENVAVADTLNFTFKNNSGATLTAGNVIVNVYLVGE